MKKQINEFLANEISTPTSNLHTAASGAHNSSLRGTVGFELKTVHFYKKYRGQKFKQMGNTVQ
jgi:hypothetical protein